ncbi:unnamed protein product [Calypogeia fissa]
MEETFTSMVSSLLWLLATVAMTVTTAAVLAGVTYLSYWWALHNGLISLNENGKLTLKSKDVPPGSMGLPLIGQTLAWKKNPDEFYDSHWKSHGEIYKTHLFGFPTVVVTTQEASKKLLISNGDSLKGHSPGQMVSIVGPHFLLFEEGDLHSTLRKRLMKHLLPESMKSLIPAIEELAIKHVSSWSNGSTIKFADEIERYTLGVGMLAFLGPLPPVSADKLNQEFTELEKGFLSLLPINKPGYQYFESMQARKRFLKEIRDIVNKRQTDQNTQRSTDILDSLIDQEDPLPQDVIYDNVIGFLFASDRTTAALIAFTVKYLHDHPDVLEEVKNEQEKIRTRKASGDPLSWEDLKDMPFTYQVMQESARLSNVGMQYRVVKKELEYGGYVIPKNWRLLTLQRQWHLDPKLFPDPHKFDPSRFETPKSSFTPFGMGTHFCAGYELARVELLIFLHHFTTKFRWEIMEDGPTEYITFPNPYARLPLKLTQL